MIIFGQFSGTGDVSSAVRKRLFNGDANFSTFSGTANNIITLLRTLCQLYQARRFSNSIHIHIITSNFFIFQSAAYFYVALIDSSTLLLLVINFTVLFTYGVIIERVRLYLYGDIIIRNDFFYYYLIWIVRLSSVWYRKVNLNSAARKIYYNWYLISDLVPSSMPLRMVIRCSW